MERISLDAAVKFVRASGKLEAWTEDQIKRAITNSIKGFALTYTQLGDTITGLCFGDWQNCGETFHVTFIAGDLRVFVEYLKHTFPQCKEVTGNRKNGKLFVIYNVAKHL